MFFNLKKFLIRLIELFTLFLILTEIFFLNINFSKADTVPGEYDFKGKVFVTDGDTLKAKKIKIRLHGIDAPESKQKCIASNQKLYPCGYRSTLFLKSLCDIFKVFLKLLIVFASQYGFWFFIVSFNI